MQFNIRGFFCRALCYFLVLLPHRTPEDLFSCSARVISLEVSVSNVCTVHVRVLYCANIQYIVVLTDWLEWLLIVCHILRIRTRAEPTHTYGLRGGEYINFNWQEPVCTSDPTCRDFQSMCATSMIENTCANTVLLSSKISWLFQRPLRTFKYLLNIVSLWIYYTCLRIR